MFCRALSAVFVLLSALFSACIASALPTDGLDLEARNILKRATPAAPHFVVYSDEWVSGENGPPAVSEVQVSLDQTQQRVILFQKLALYREQDIVRDTRLGRDITHV